MSLLRTVKGTGDCVAGTTVCNQSTISLYLRLSASDTQVRWFKSDRWAFRTFFFSCTTCLGSPLHVKTNTFCSINRTTRRLLSVNHYESSWGNKPCKRPRYWFNHLASTSKSPGKSTQVSSLQSSYDVNWEESRSRRRLYLVSSHSELQAITDCFLISERYAS